MTTTVLEAPRRVYGWRSWRQMAFELFFGSMAGIAITLLETGGTRQLADGKSFLRNAIIGILITACSRLLETMLSWAIQQSRIPVVFRATIYAIGGWLGYLVAIGIAAGFGATDPDEFNIRSYHFGYSIGASTLIAILVGFVLHHNQKRGDRLRASVARLKEHEFAEKELEIAREMQQRLLPPATIEREGYRVTARTEAAHLVGGDFYDVLRLNDGAVAVLAADVSGKGIAASLLMASCKAAVPYLASTGGAAEVMTALNASLVEQLQRREFVAMVFCRYLPATGELEIVNAGMPDPLVAGANGDRSVTFQGNRLPLGAMRATKYEATRITIERGERLVLFSDGLPEATIGETALGYERVEALLRTSLDAGALFEKFRRIDGVRIEDDVTIVVLERTE